MRILFGDLAKARRKLIDSKALTDDPLPNRLWYHHMFWVWSFVKSAATINGKGIAFAAYRRLCRVADRGSSAARANTNFVRR